ncbi:MAG: cytochrome C [Proteobacteria bacterium]|nr:cytochrome C [Pseudomonadota bacterium]
MILRDLIGMARRLRHIIVTSWVLLGMSAGAAHAVPAFAVQTGQPCQACHVGGFGPQLTPFGREFKLHGYTQRAVGFNVPISAMAVASYVHSKMDASSPPADGFANNDNTAVDQISLFLAGGLGSHLGAFIQTTYDGIAKAWTWDNLDVRATTTTEVKGHDVVLGVSLNNSPSVQDAWNTLPAWGYPYTSSALAPSPSASPLLAGGLAQNTLGVTGYAWIDDKLLLEAGAYGSPSATTLNHLGADPFSPGDIDGLAPYVRVAFQKPVGPGTAEVGVFGMRADIHPGRDRSTGLVDRYTDVGADASYFVPLASGDTFTLNARYTHEQQALDATCALAESESDCPHNSLTDVRADASYYWRSKVGVTVAAFATTGAANPTIYADSRTFKPNSSGVTVQLDATPWGDGHSPLGPRFNVRVGAQYTAYATFNGASSNYDNAGANASDNNTLRVFTWIAY